VHPDPPLVVGPLAATVCWMGEQRDELARRETELVGALTDAQRGLAVQRDRVGELSDALTAERQRAGELRELLDTIERTVSWRLRTVALPVLRPLARARRIVVRRVRSIRRGR
jgi:hypothetical protein